MERTIRVTVEDSGDYGERYASVLAAIEAAVELHAGVTVEEGL